ncbi:hypothetical protein [Faecalicatena orotica]|uniref:hypothetical protein n=1 Tax=Faecalicatena orotica TaxID=1544 RepID=UPI0032164FF2
MDEKALREQEEVIQLLIESYNEVDILSASRKLGIDPSGFYANGITIAKLANDFVIRVYQLGKNKELNDYIARERIGIDSKINISNKSAEKFSLLLNSFLDNLSDIDGEDFAESDLFDPIEFEDKMRNRAKLSEDVIRQGITLKPDIVVLRRKANALDYEKYSKLIQKLAKFYLYIICEKFPRDKCSANERFAELRKALLRFIPDNLYDKDDEIEEYIDGIIFDTISKCLIFND